MDDLDGKKTERLEVYVSPELELVLRRAAESDGRKLSQYVGRLLLAHAMSLHDAPAARQANLTPLCTPLRGDAA